MKLLVDMNLSPRWVETLTHAGFEAAHRSSLGAPDASNAAIMAFARDNEYVVLTHDLDFAAILAATKAARPSVVQIRAENISPDAAAGPLIGALRQMAASLADGALLTIDPIHARLRILPLGQK
jgi:predicted nuclease of predicted toxin-antitoxin system